MTAFPDPLAREVLLSFWKVHILHHAAEGPVYGQWIANELRRHGYHISPGTLYPLLKRMEGHGWLKARRRVHAGMHARKEYLLTKNGARILSQIRRQVGELHREVVRDRSRKVGRND